MMEDESMDAIKTLDDLLKKTANSTSNENRESAVGALQILFDEDGDGKRVAKYLMEFHYSVCQSFFERFCSSASDDNISAVAKALVNDEKFRNSNQNHIMHQSLSAVLALAEKRKYQASFLILNLILSQSEKSGNFSNGCVKTCKKLMKQNGKQSIQNLFEQTKKGGIDCKESEQNRLARFINALNDNVLVVAPERATITSSNSGSSQPALPPVTQTSSMPSSFPEL
jgi:hypothetical protein